MANLTPDDRGAKKRITTQLGRLFAGQIHARPLTDGHFHGLLIAGHLQELLFSGHFKEPLLAGHLAPDIERTRGACLFMYIIMRFAENETFRSLLKTFNSITILPVFRSHV